MSYKSRVLVDESYVRALGQAVYSFSYLEWGAIWMVEKLTGEFINQSLYKMMSGQVAAALKKAVKSNRSRFSDEVYEELRNCYKALFHAVDIRADLLHAHPFTAEGGEQRLGRQGQFDRIDWGVDKIEAATEFFEDLSVKMNKLFYDHLYEEPAS